MISRPATAGSLIIALQLLLVGLLLASCGDPEPQLKPLSPGARVLAFGDSITFGTGAGRGQSYPDHLARATGLELINAGIPGEISAEGLRRLPALLDQHNPDLLILCHGGNDILRRLAPEQLRNNLAAMIDAAQQRGIRVFVIGVPKFGLLLSTAPLYREIAEQKGVPMDADTLPEILRNNGLKSDSIHPNAAGYRHLADAVQRGLQLAGAL